MAELDDLARLRAADPVDPAAVPSAEDPRAAGLRERIVMSEIQSTTRSRAPMLAGAVAAMVLVAAGVVVATRGGGDPAPADPGPGPQAAGCVETYSLETLKNREIAFDGIVTSVSGESISFEVNEWFRGGSGGETTLKGATVLGGMTSAGSGVPLEPGSRLLVAGDGGFAWGCGFTQPYDGSVASDWKTALS